MKNIYFQILDLQTDISQLVLATVTSTSGSTPQKPGSSALFGKKGLVAGTVGGGIIEGKVTDIAVNALLSKESGLYTFNLANDISKTEEAICGGQISVLIDANLQNSSSVLIKMKKSLNEGIPGVLVTMVTGYTEKIVMINRYWMSEIVLPDIPERFSEKIKPVILNMLSSANPAEYKVMELAIEGEEPSSLFYLEPVFPLPILVIAGAGHIGRALAHLGNLLDFEVVVIDDRSEYANTENIPDANRIIVRNIGEAVGELKKNSDTYIVIVTRGHKDDAAALKSCIGSAVAYIGMIGSKRKVETMRTNFLENGLATPEQWNTVCAPVGIDIGSQSVEEIAVSIAAQLVLVRNGRRQI